MKEITICTFDIRVPFEEWAKIFDHDEAPIRKKNGITILFRGISKEDSSKAVVVVEAEEGALEKHIGENYELFQEHGAVMETAVPTLWSAE
ncbi:MAG: DUF3764 family protein [Candidatus Latescibacterota bacterium]|nr:DUF3764 family protein [Candidatus Latescibacterota bacterium]